MDMSDVDDKIGLSQISGAPRRGEEPYGNAPRRINSTGGGTHTLQVPGAGELCFTPRASANSIVHSHALYVSRVAGACQIYPKHTSGSTRENTNLEHDT